MKLRTLIIFTLLVLGIAGSASAQRTLGGSEWSFTYLKGANIGSIDAHVKFDGTGRRVTGSTGCNVLNGNVTTHGNSVRFGAMITTKRFCTRETAPVESAVLSALNRATRFQRSRNRLRLYSGRTVVAELGPRPVNVDQNGPLNPGDQLNLEDRKWILDLISGVSIPNVEQEAFIVFDPGKGSAGGDTSCNAYGGDYKVNGDKIAITQIISTMRACIEDERMNIERRFLDGLRTADRYVIKADRLMLYRRNKLLLTFVGRTK